MKVAILVVHGMGSQTPQFAEDLISEINQRIGKQHTEIAWQPVYWADVLEARELRYLRKAQQDADLDYLKLRRFVAMSLGDAVGYQQVRSQANQTYEEVHARVAAAVKDLYEVQLGGTPVPLLVVAHSLGGHIMSNYIWDVQRSQESNPTSDFEKFHTHAGMITFGCNIPLFTFAYSKVVPIDFPGKGLAPEEKAKAKWLNFYDPDDVPGWPLKPINPAYNKVVNKDIAINVGGLTSSWNPMSHDEYWTDNDFTKPLADFVGTFL